MASVREVIVVMHKFTSIAIAVLYALVALIGCKPAPQAPPSTPVPSPTPALTPTPPPTPMPTPFVKRKPMDTGMLFNGLQYKWSVKTAPGDTATHDRVKDDSYRVDLTLNILVPRAAKTLEELKAANAQLAEALPTLPTMLEGANVSPDYDSLYKRKMEWLQERLERLDQILSRHNYYDCDTILELRHPETGARALLLQGDMDVNVDGSDGDRNVVVDGSGQFFQPQTSYRWAKMTKRPNPFIVKFQDKIDKATQELTQPDVSEVQRTELRSQIAEWKHQIADLKSASFLISKTDPFIVLPSFMLRSGAASIGDYAVVIHQGKIYPAIVGDAGPSYKMGEASLRLCHEIKNTGTALARPVSDLSVTYLVFPGSADTKRSQPNLDRWYERCSELLAGLGMTNNTALHRWENLVPPWPTPTPTPTPAPASTPIASPSPTPTPEGTPLVDVGGSPASTPGSIPTAEGQPSPLP